MKTLRIAALACALAGPAHATAEISCTGIDDKDVFVSLIVGSVPGLAVVGTLIQTKDHDWTLGGVAGVTPITLVQAARDGDRIIADYADENVERIVASLRLLNAQEGDDDVTVGTLSLPGIGVFALSCEGP